MIFILDLSVTLFTYVAHELLFYVFPANGGAPDEIPAPGGKVLGAGWYI